MPPDLAGEYLRKGQEDETLLTETLENQSIADSIFGFHAQQAIEKYLKAVLVHAGQPVQKVHDLQYLWQLLDEAGVADLPDVDRADSLTVFAVKDRYPFGDMGLPEPRTAILELVTEIRAWAERTIRPPE